MLSIDQIDDRARWNDALRDMPYAHILQTWDWGEFKRATGGWHPQRLAFRRKGRIVALASLMMRRIGLLKVMMVSKGPALDYADGALAEAVIAQLERRARSLGTVWLKIDPDVVAGTGIPGSDDATSDAIGAHVMDMLAARGWRFSAAQVQFRNTLIIDLRRA